MATRWVTGEELFAGGIQPFQLAEALRNELLIGRDAISGKQVLDKNTSMAKHSCASLEDARVKYYLILQEYKELSEEQKAIEHIKRCYQSPGYEQVREEMLRAAREADENCITHVYNIYKSYPDNVIICDFNCENHKKNREKFLNALRGLLFDINDVVTCFPEWSDLARSIRIPEQTQEGHTASPDRETRSVVAEVSESQDTPEALLKALKARGERDPKELARRLKKEFPGLPPAEIGKLLPADPDRTISWGGRNTRGKRLLGLKK